MYNPLFTRDPLIYVDLLIGSVEVGGGGLDRTRA